MINSSIYPPTHQTYPTITTGTTTAGNLFVGSAGTTSGSSFYYTNTTATPYSDVIIGNSENGTKLQVKGDAEFEGDIKLKGKSLDKSLTRIEERLAILHPNERLEKKWEKLRELRKQYMELEAEIIEKEEIWKILKR